jgi:hypothetical protein
MQARRQEAGHYLLPGVLKGKFDVTSTEKGLTKTKKGAIRRQ